MKIRTLFLFPILLLWLALVALGLFYSARRPPVVTAELVSITTNRFTGTDPGQPDAAEFRIAFKVTARGDDVFVIGDLERDTPGSPGNRVFGWSLTPDSGPGVRPVAAALVPLDGIGSRDAPLAPRRFYVADGDTRTFAFHVRVEAERDNVSAGVQIDSIRWGETSGGMAWRSIDFGPEELKTGLVTGLYVR